MAWDKAGRDGKPKKNGLLQALEVDAVGLLRSDHFKDRINARYYLLEKGWSVAQISEAESKEDEA